MKYCRHCGHEISDDALFCRSCGKGIADKPAPAPTEKDAPAPAETGAVKKPAPPSFTKSAAKGKARAAAQKGNFIAGKGRFIAVALTVVVVALAALALFNLPPEGPGSPSAFSSGTASTREVSDTSSVSASSAQSASANSVSASSGEGAARAGDSKDTSEGSSSPPASAPSAESVSTGQRPEVSDFSWFNEGNPEASRPKDANAISDFPSLVGGWKAMLVFDPDNVANAYAHNYLNVWISGAEGNFAIGLDWYYSEVDGEWFDESDYEDTWLNGDWAQDGSLVGRGDAVLTITSFYYVDGKQYALGTLESVDGIRNLVALVRP